MFELTVKRKFSAAHQLRGYEGKCENIHGHTYGLEVFVQAEKLNELGLAADFKEIKRIVDQIIERYDHCLVNEIPPFDQLNPSAENMARVFYRELKDKLPDGLALSRVMVWESEDAGASYFE